MPNLPQIKYLKKKIKKIIQMVDAHTDGQSHTSYIVGVMYTIFSLSFITF